MAQCLETEEASPCTPEVQNRMVLTSIIRMQQMQILSTVPATFKFIYWDHARKWSG
jgi:hypothetical protein